MPKKIIKFCFFILCLLEIIFFLIYSFTWKNYFIDTVELWLYKVVVSIVPMYVFSSILITIPFISKIFFNIFKPLKLFENQKALSLFTISFLTGNPTSTILVKKAYLNNEISLIQANNIIDSSSHISFLFIILIFDKEIAIILIISQIIATLILYLTKKRLNPNITNYKNNSILNTVNDIIEDLPLVLLKILATMIIVVIFKLPFIMFNHTFLNYVLDFLEVTKGINNLVNYNIHIYLKLFLCSSLLSMNGGAILLQVFNVIKKTKLSFRKYLYGRFFHAILSSIISLVILVLI